LRYPLAQNEKYNRSEEERCLTNFKSILASNTVGAVIIEPISGINGQIATPNFYK
jgi:adenosylmethionine-8-amino-7-oxononanoate aminotransferase